MERVLARNWLGVSCVSKEIQSEIQSQSRIRSFDLHMLIIAIYIGADHSFKVLVFIKVDMIFIIIQGRTEAIVF